MTQQIMELCRAMGAGKDQEELLLPLVQTVQENLRNQLRDGVSPENCGQAFPMAVAALAMEALEQVGETGGTVTSFTAGDLMIQRRPGAAVRRSMLAERWLSPWLKDGGFVFQGVCG